MRALIFCRTPLNHYFETSQKTLEIPLGSNINSPTNPSHAPTSAQPCALVPGRSLSAPWLRATKLLCWKSGPRHAGRKSRQLQSPIRHPGRWNWKHKDVNPQNTCRPKTRLTKDSIASNSMWHLRRYTYSKSKNGHRGAEFSNHSARNLHFDSALTETADCDHWPLGPAPLHQWKSASNKVKCNFIASELSTWFYYGASRKSPVWRRNVPRWVGTYLPTGRVMNWRRQPVHLNWHS